MGTGVSMIDAQRPAMNQTSPVSSLNRHAAKEAAPGWLDAWQLESAKGHQPVLAHDKRNERNEQNAAQGLQLALLAETYLADQSGTAGDSAVLTEAAEHADAVCAAQQHAAAADGADQAQAMHLHAEWSDSGMRLWIGAAAPLFGPSGLASGMVLLGRSLRLGLARQGVRLSTLVCNGQTLYSTGPEARADSHRPGEP